MKGRKTMKRGIATFLTGIMTVTLVAAGLTGCGSSTAGKRSEKVRLMVWSPSEDQSKDSGEWLQTMCNNFAKEHPEWDITFVYGVADEATAADQVAQDPEASADVFLYANDRITSLTDADAVAKFGGKYKEEIEKDKLYVSFALSALIVNIWALPCFSPFPLRYVLLAICGCTLYKQPVSGGSGQAIENIKICGCRDIGFANTHCLDL